MSEQDSVEPEGVGGRPTTRRDVLKKAAIVGGLAWSMPVIESMTTPAYAGSQRPCGPFDCKTDRPTCPCVDPVGVAGQLVQGVDGKCQCIIGQWDFVDNCEECSAFPNQPLCVSTPNCPKAFGCFVTC